MPFLHDARPRAPHRSQATPLHEPIKRRNSPPVMMLSEQEAIECAKRIGKFSRESAARAPEA